MIDLLRNNSEVPASEAGHPQEVAPDQSFETTESQFETPNLGQQSGAEEEQQPTEAVEPTLDTSSVLDAVPNSVDEVLNQETTSLSDEDRTQTLLTEENKVNPEDASTARELLQSLINPKS